MEVASGWKLGVGLAKIGVCGGAEKGYSLVPGRAWAWPPCWLGPGGDSRIGRDNLRTTERSHDNLTSHLGGPWTHLPCQRLSTSFLSRDRSVNLTAEPSRAFLSATRDRYCARVNVLPCRLELSPAARTDANNLTAWFIIVYALLSLGLGWNVYLHWFRTMLLC